MFAFTENLSTTTKVLLGVTALGIAATAVSAIKDHKENCECEECIDEIVDEIVDPTAAV